MSKIIKLSKEEAIEIIEDNKPVKTGTWKYGRFESYVFEKHGLNYMFDLNIHSHDGWQLQDTVIAHKVKPVEKTIVDWVIDNT